MDFNNYWLLEEEDEENLRYILENFKPLRLYVGLVGGGMARKEILNKNLEGKILDFEPKENGFLFKIGGENSYFFEGLRKKGFDVRYDSKDNFRLVTVDYEKREYVEIHFEGKIEVEPSEFERAEGIPFYKIKKS